MKPRVGLVVALTIALAGCGDSSSGNPDRLAQTSGSSQGDKPAAVSNEDAVREVAESDFSDAQKVCDISTEAYQAEIVKQGKIAGAGFEGADCVETMKNAIKATQAMGFTGKGPVANIRVSGNKATATKTYENGAQDQLSKLDFEKTDDGWKLAGER